MDAGPINDPPIGRLRRQPPGGRECLWRACITIGKTRS